MDGKENLKLPTTRPEDWLSNTEKGKVLCMVAEIMVDKGSPVRISQNAVDNYGEKIPGWVEISGTKEVDLMLDKITSTPEFLALWVATKRLEFDSPDVQSCQWEEDVKKRVLALYWQNYSESWRRFAEEIPRESSEEPRERRYLRESESQTGQKRAEALLGRHLKSLSTPEIRALLAEVVGRVIAETKDFNQAI